MEGRCRRVSMDVIIYHNPQCGTSRNTLGLIRNAGIEPHVVEYLKTPPTRALLVQLIGRMRIAVRDLALPPGGRGQTQEKLPARRVSKLRKWRRAPLKRGWAATLQTSKAGGSRVRARRRRRT